MLVALYRCRDQVLRHRLDKLLTSSCTSCLRATHTSSTIWYSTSNRLRYVRTSTFVFAHRGVGWEGALGVPLVSPKINSNYTISNGGWGNVVNEVANERERSAPAYTSSVHEILWCTFKRREHRRCYRVHVCRPR